MPASSKNLVFMDSGIGGIPYLRWVRERRPGWRYFYVADNGYFPYGGRDPEDLKQRLVKLTGLMVRRYRPDIIVLACNTASVTALSELRSRFSVPFVGVVPAVKPAAEKHTRGRIGVLATKGTVEGDYLKELIRKFASRSDKVDCLAAPDLVRFVEDELAGADEQRIKGILTPYLREAEARQWTYMVLGCTHFLFLKPWLEKWKSPDLSIVDSTEGVGNRILNILESQGDTGIPSLSSHPVDSLFFLTDKNLPSRNYEKLVVSENMTLNALEADLI